MYKIEGTFDLVVFNKKFPYTSAYYKSYKTQTLCYSKPKTVPGEPHVWCVVLYRYERLRSGQENSSGVGSGKLLYIPFHLKGVF